MKTDRTATETVLFAAAGAALFLATVLSLAPMPAAVGTVARAEARATAATSETTETIVVTAKRVA
jgi:hypothetical protein